MKDERGLVTVFGGARVPADSSLYADCIELGRLLAEAGYVVATGGYTGAMEAVLRRVHAGADDDNAASIAVLRRAGLRVWGQDRDAYRRSDGSLTGGVYVELLATDPR